MSKRPHADHQHQAKATLDELRQGLQGPSLTIDGIQYFSDRFYLNSVPGVDHPNRPLPQSACTCGAQEPPPLFSRERLLKSLSLKAAIMGTFTMNTLWLRGEFPELFEPNATIPTLVVHGDKRMKREKTIKKKVQGEIFSDEESISELENSQPTVIPGFGATSSNHLDTSPRSKAGIPLVEFPPNRLVDDASESQEVETSSSVGGGHSLETQVQVEKSENTLNRSFAQTNDSKDNVTPTKNGKILMVTQQQASGPTFQSIDSGNNCHFTFIQSIWKKTSEVENRGVSMEAKATTLQTKRGVHHPKFMILFETSGNVVVVVSTANLAHTKTVEGSWVQRFFTSKRKTGNTTALPRTARQNDFGSVLQDFLQKLDLSAAPGDTKIQDFFHQHLCFPLTELADSFLFHRASVHLIPVVPGDFSIKSEAYGRLRVQAILRRAREQHTVVEHKKDFLFIQPTSFGGNWKQTEMADMVRSYLDLDKKTEGYWDDETILKRMSILWPSRTFMKNLGRAAGDILSVKQVERIPIKEEIDDDRAHGATLFMSSNCFNSCEMACLSRMSRFHWSDPPQHTSFMIPHFKSVCRVIRKPAPIRSQHGFDDSAKTFFSWFLMTSACMSHGAQGRRDRFSEMAKNTISFANFELGILFASRVEKSMKVIYTFQPRKCSCRSPNPQKRLIHLPVPFSTTMDPYLQTDKDGDHGFLMTETPFLHQVDAGTRCVGNMMMTPYGVMKAKKQRTDL